MLLNARRGMGGTSVLCQTEALLERFRVLIVDDYEPWRQFVRSALRKRTELEIVGESSDGLQAIQQAQELHPDLILLDLGLPTIDGIETARRLRKLLPRSKILFLSQESSPEIVEKAMSTGARGYVVKQSLNELLRAVTAALAA
jgi:DNA-binding NarL/FixJ family response regulator